MEEIKLTPHRLEMMEFLRNASKDHPMNLRSAFSLDHESTKNTYYHDYLLLVKAGYIQTDKRGCWLTVAGHERLKKELRKNLKLTR